MISKLAYNDIGKYVTFSGTVGVTNVLFRGKIRDYNNADKKCRVVVETKANRSILRGEKSPNEWKDLKTREVNYEAVTFDK